MQFKLLVLGDLHVGKTSLLVRFWDDRFTDVYSTPPDFRYKAVKLGDTVINLQMWDTGGGEKFRPLSRLQYRATHGLAIVFNLTDPISFDNVGSWIEEANNFAGDDAVQLLVGNKLDLSSKREVLSEAAKEFASHNDIQYIETSAKTGQNVEQAFMTLTAKVKDQYDAEVFTIDDPPVKISDDQNEHNSWLKTCAC